MKNRGHGRLIKAEQRPIYQPLVIDGTELIDQQVGVLVQAALSGNAKAERLDIVNKVGGKGKNQG